MKIFISGPMTGHPKLNRDVFNVTEEELISLGHEVINPIDYLDVKEWSGADVEWTDDMYRETLSDMLDEIMHRGIEVVVVLPGWEESMGSRAEIAVAQACKIPVVSSNFIGDIR